MILRISVEYKINDQIKLNLELFEYKILRQDMLKNKIYICQYNRVFYQINNEDINKIKSYDHCKDYEVHIWSYPKDKYKNISKLLKYLANKFNLYELDCKIK